MYQYVIYNEPKILVSLNYLQKRTCYLAFARKPKKKQNETKYDFL